MQHQLSSIGSRNRGNDLMRTIEIDGKRYPWRQILSMRREQRRRERQPQPTLFALKDDTRPPSQRTAQGRFQEPLLFGEQNGNEK